jgi:hypothetical protein
LPKTLSEYIRHEILKESLQLILEQGQLERRDLQITRPFIFSKHLKVTLLLLCHVNELRIDMCPIVFPLPIHSCALRLLLIFPYQNQLFTQQVLCSLFPEFPEGFTKGGKEDK